MLKAKIIQSTTNNIAPNVYIDSIEVYNKEINVYFRLEDIKPDSIKRSKWITNQYVLDNIFLVIECGDKTYKQTLNFIKKKNEVKDYTIKDFVNFKNINTDGNITLAAYCSNENKTIIGETVREVILSNGIINKSSYEKSSFVYINKIKDLRLFNLENIVLSKKEDKEPKYQNQKIYITYPFSKKVANFAYFFDLESYLDEKSNSYRILKRHKNFREKILANSTINERSISFYKKNLDQKDLEIYKKITSPIKILKINKSILDKKFLIISSDEEQKNLNLSKYLLKISIDVIDYSNDFLKKEIINNLQLVKKFIISYKENFEFISKDKQTSDPNIYIFENHYEKNIDNILNYINILSNIFSFYTNKNQVVYNGLFLSIFHPLTTRTELLEKLLSAINFIEKIFSSLIKEINAESSGNSESPLQNTPVFTQEFKEIIDTEGKNYIDYEYDCFNGYDSLEHETREVRMAQKRDFIKIISKETFEERLNLESEKYFANRMPDAVKNIKHLSISSIDNKEISFNLLNSGNFVEGTVSDSSSNQVTFDDLLTIINNYNENVITPLNKEESIFLELAKNNIYLRSIAKGKNKSKNVKQINILFDNNEDSKNISRKYLKDTGINDFYYMVDKNKFIMPRETTITQIYYSIRDKTFLNTNIILTPQNVADPKQKSKLIFLYNNFFKIKEIVSGDLYSLYYLAEEQVNLLFQQKLKFFNDFYIVQKSQESAETIVQQIIDPKMIQELKVDIHPALMSRTVTKEYLNFSMSEL